ncbi:uncharacterized protein LOC107465299 [Arachis duranensis]|uniref:Uncharacterized protein LOC107465299 n=1 Tax=Arachis duranensis TaxID=130453 RepID=A0A6P5MXH9_ARADU|nr:uncharacterized protein LOC107465299 [Arachis duranensis]
MNSDNEGLMAREKEKEERTEVDDVAEMGGTIIQAKPNLNISIPQSDPKKTYSLSAGVCHAAVAGVPHCRRCRGSAAPSLLDQPSAAPLIFSMHLQAFSSPSRGLGSGSSSVTLCSAAPPSLEFQPLRRCWARVSLLPHHCCTSALSLLSLAKLLEDQNNIEASLSVQSEDRKDMAEYCQSRREENRNAIK